jgi:outer membrane protein W
VKALLAAALLLAAAPAFAQHTEISAVFGYTTAGDIEMKAPQFQELAIADSFTAGLEVARFFNARVGVEGAWIRQHSGLSFTTRSGSGELFGVHADQLQASFVYQLGSEDARLQPFLSAGLGATIFSAHEAGTEAKLAPVVAAGLKWYPSAGNVGARVLARYIPTHLDDSESDFCDPFGFCQSWLQQFQLLGGVTFRF